MSALDALGTVDLDFHFEGFDLFYPRGVVHSGIPTSEWSVLPPHFFWSNLNDFFLTELSLITLNRFLVQFLFHYFMMLISSNAVSCAQICQLLTSGPDACTVDVLTNSALPSHCCCNSQTSQLAVFKHRAVFEEGPGGLGKTKPMPSL